MRELRVAGIVDATQRRTDTGAYDTGSYRISTPAGITIVDTTPHVRTTTEPAAQLSLAIEP